MQVHITVPHTAIAAVLAATTLAAKAAERMHVLTVRQVVTDLGWVVLGQKVTADVAHNSAKFKSTKA